MPTLGVTSNRVDPKCVNFGSVEIVGVPPRTIDLPIIRHREMTMEEMFSLPRSNLEEIQERERRLEGVCVTDRDARVTFTARKRKTPPNVRGVAARARDLFSSTQGSIGGQNQMVSATESESKHDGTDPCQEAKEPMSEDGWYESISNCEPGAFAAVHSNYNDSLGLAIVKVWIKWFICVTSVSKVCQKCQKML